MQLPKLAIEYHQFTIVSIVLLLIYGLLSFFTMPRSEDPQVTSPEVWVTIIYPGATPSDLEELIVDPIEEAVNELDNIKKVNSSSRDNVAVVALQFYAGTDMDKAYSDFVDKVNAVRSKLPSDIFSIETYKASITDFVNILQLAIISDSATYKSLNDKAEDLKKLLEKVPGIKRSEISALPKREVRISINPEKMAQMKIPLGLIIQALQSNNTNIPGGKIKLGSKNFSIQTSGSYKDLDEIKNTVLWSANNNIIYIKDVAQVDFAYEDIDYIARYMGRRAVFVSATQKEGTNIFNVTDAVDKQLQEYIKGLPQDMKLEYVFKQAESVSRRLDNFFENLWQGMILVGIVMLFILGIRASIIIMLAIPTSIFIAIGLLDLSGYTIEQMSIAGLVIALGMLVDNAIVVIQNTSRFLRMGLKSDEAAIEGTSQVAWAVSSSTLTTVFAFIPIMMIRDVTGDYIRSMPLIVVLSLMASLFLSLTFTPYLSAHFLNIAQKMSKMESLMVSFIEKYYRRILKMALMSPKKVLIYAIVIFAMSLGLFPFIGVSFFPKAEKPFIIININAPEGTNLDKTNEIASELEKILFKNSKIKKYAVNVGHGNPRIYYNVISKEHADNHAQIMIETRDTDPGSISDLVSELRETFYDYPSAKIEVKELEQGPPVEAPVAIRIIGENLERLKQLSFDAEDIIKSEPGIINVNNPLGNLKTDLYIRINKAKAGMAGVQIIDIERSVRACMTGYPASIYKDVDGEKYNITVRLPVNNSPRMIDFDKIHITSYSGVQIPLRQLTTIEFKTTPLLITHYQLERSNTITADVLPGYSVDEVTKSIMNKINNRQWEAGYKFVAGGEMETREEAFGGMTFAGILAIIAIFAILILQFKSFSQPFIIFSTVPLALTGSFIALFLTGNTFSFTAFIGLTSLVGIVVNNSIILVDYTNLLVQQGKEIDSAIIESGETRFIPIFLTTGTTIGGLLPLTLQGGTLWAPMGWTIIGGLTLSTMLTLVITPVLYKLLSKNNRGKLIERS